MTVVEAVSREQLEEQRAFLLASLADLDEEWEAGDISADDYAALKDDYTARAAAVLRALDRLDGKPVAGATATGARPRARVPSATRKRRPVWPLVVSGVVTLAVAIAAGVLVTRTSGERLPGEGATGGPTSATADLLDRATIADQGGKVLDALKLYDAVLAQDPENVIALTYKGWLLGRQPNAELVARGLEPLDRAVKIDPTFADAHVFRGLVLIRNQRPGEAVCELRTYLAIAPPGNPQTPSVETALDEATKQAGGNIPDCPKPIQPAPGQPGASTPTTMIP
jgi:tetratricopeptide (TPR) repeat protein